MSNNRRDPAFQLGKMTEAERKAWCQLEESRQAGASAERMKELLTHANDLSESVRSLHRDAYENGFSRGDR